MLLCCEFRNKPLLFILSNLQVRRTETMLLCNLAVAAASYLLLTRGK